MVAVALLSGDETLARMQQRQALQVENYGMTSEAELEINTQMTPASPGWWPALRERVGEWWRDRIKEFGFGLDP